MEQIIELLHSLNFWAVVGSVASVAGAVAAILTMPELARAI